MLKAAGALILCGAFLLGGSAPTMAAPHPKVRLKVVYGVKGGSAKSAWLHCAPVGGTHPNAQAACRMLRRVKGEPSKLNANPNAACTQEIQPHAAVVAGQWYGRKVHWAKFFANGCQMRAVGGSVLAI
ncbi:SSI family serine proteinase inhibitor [Nonomuraea sp. NPDC050404]|uniref:SSI family serine proteinase inhibitor n=1 Tax=Nonomuraea sp. NPDC050404 TaxID=3155783 RepID=UPI003400755B